jgi:hypothetical protein
MFQDVTLHVHQFEIYRSSKCVLCDSVFLNSHVH